MKLFFYILFFLSGLHSWAQCPQPYGEATQTFCNAAVLAQINEPPATLEDVVVYGQNLQWYSDAAGTQAIPFTTLLTDGSTYYVSQTTGGCESPLLTVTLSEKFCNCVPNGGFEKGDDTSQIPQYDFYRYWTQQTSSPKYPVGMQGCQTDVSAVNRQPLSPGIVNLLYSSVTVNDLCYTNEDLFNGYITDRFVNVPRINTDNPYSQRAIRMGDGVGAGTLVIMEKDFVAGQNFNYHMSLVLDWTPYPSPPPPVFYEPFYRAEIFDQNGSLVASHCVIPEDENCIFNLGGSNNEYHYTEWTCMQLDTRSIAGQPAKLVISVSDNSLPGWSSGTAAGYVYLDDLGAETCDDSVFGGVSLEEVTPDPFAPCSLVGPFVDDACSPGLPSRITGLPQQVCGTYNNPRNGYLNGVSLEIYQNNQLVGTTSNATTPGANQFCFNLQASDISVPPYGTFTFAVQADFSCSSSTYVNESRSTGAGIAICPIAECPNDIDLCYLSGNSPAFDLTQQDAAVIGNMPANEVNVVYYTNLNDAENAQNAITNPTNYTPAQNPQTIYARLDWDNTTLGIAPIPDCYDIVSFEVDAQPNPNVPSPLPTLELCDDDTDGIATFDLTDNESTILSNEPNPANFDVTYYADATDLANGNTIANETAYDNTAPNTQTIFVLVENLTTGCTTEAQFDIVVNPLPSYNAPQALIICDDASANGTATFTLSNATTQITGNNPNLNVSYFPSQATAQTGDPNDELPNSYTNTTPFNETIWVRIHNINTQCFVVDSLDLQVDQAPQANTPQDFIYCDDDNDGVGQFILTDLDDEINNDPNVTITYHQTQANADNNVLPLSSPFTNTVNTTQVIYVRVESPGVDCYSTVTATLVVEDSPQPVLAADLDPLEACDDNNSGNAVFDLTQMEPAILANEATPSDFTVTYYQTQNDADNQTNPITVPAAYTSNGMNQTIFVVVEGLNGCLGETSFELIVNPLPSVNPPSALELCDYNNPGDEMEAFNLNDATLEITGGDNSIDVTYYETQADADAGTNPLSSPYTNTVNNQTIYIRSVDQDTGCSVTQGYTLTLVVNPLPSPQVPTDPLLVCDADNDGFAEFDLDAQTPIITNGEVNVVITYHITQANAVAGTNPIDTTQPYGIVAGNGVQTLYVRATNSVTGCYVVEVLELEVVPSPEIGSLEDLFVCDDATADGFALFDLTVNTTNVIGNQNPADVTVTYYETQADAEAGTNAIAVPQMYTNNVNPQRIFVRIENDATGCIDTFDTTNDNSFWIEVEDNPDVMDPTNLQVCDDDYATNPVPQNIFNLTVKEGEISGQNFPPNSYEFTYYANDADFQAGNAIEDPTSYENQTNPQTIIVEVVDTTTEGMCTSTVNLTIEVLPLPSPSEDDQDVLRLEQCDDDNDGIAADGFDLTQSGDLISARENVIFKF